MSTNLNKNTKNNYIRIFGIGLGVFAFSHPVYADWFNVGEIKTNIIAPIYTLAVENVGLIAFAVGGLTTFIARGQDMWQKALAFGLGSIGTAGAVKVAQTVMHLG